MEFSEVGVEAADNRRQPDPHDGAAEGNRAESVCEGREARPLSFPMSRDKNRRFMQGGAFQALGVCGSWARPGRGASAREADGGVGAAYVVPRRPSSPRCGTANPHNPSAIQKCGGGREC